MDSKSPLLNKRVTLRPAWPMSLLTRRRLRSPKYEMDLLRITQLVSGRDGVRSGSPEPGPSSH